jgi:hypothetical protein
MSSSSRHHEHLLVQQKQSPFYQFATPFELPALGSDYIDFLIQRVRSHYHIQLTPLTLQRAFQRLEYNPYWMNRMLHYLILQQSSMTESLEHTLMLMEIAEGYEQLAQTLKPIDKLLFSALCEGQSPFNKALLERIERETQVKGIPPNVQRSLKRLQEAQLISHLLKGEYGIEKPRFKRYLSTSSPL